MSTNRIRSGDYFKAADYGVRGGYVPGADWNAHPYDDTAALAAVLALCQARNGTLLMPGGGFCKTTSRLDITAGMKVVGHSRGLSGISPGLAVNGIKINTGMTGLGLRPGPAVTLESFGIQYPSAANSGVTGIELTSSIDLNAASKFQNLAIVDADRGIVTVNAANWVFDDIVLTGCVSTGIQVDDPYNADAGDSTITNCDFSSPPTCTQIKQLRSGGLRVVNNKLNGGLYGYVMELADGAVTAQLFIANNSIDGVVNTGIIFSRVGTTALWGSVNIIGNWITGLRSVNIPTDPSGKWISQFNVVANTMIGGDPTSVTAYGLVNIESCDGFVVMCNSMRSLGSLVRGVIAGASADQGKVGLNSHFGIFGADIINSTNTQQV